MHTLTWSSPWFKPTCTHLQHREQSSQIALHPSCSRVSSQCGAWCTPTIHLGSSPAAESMSQEQTKSKKCYVSHKRLSSRLYPSRIEVSLTNVIPDKCLIVRFGTFLGTVTQQHVRVLKTLSTIGLFHVEMSDSWFFFTDILGCWWNPQIPYHCFLRNSVVKLLLCPTQLCGQPQCISPSVSLQAKAWVFRMPLLYQVMILDSVTS